MISCRAHETIRLRKPPHLRIIPPCAQILQPHGGVEPLARVAQPRLRRADLLPVGRPLPRIEERPGGVYGLAHAPQGVGEGVGPRLVRELTQGLVPDEIPRVAVIE